MTTDTFTATTFKPSLNLWKKSTPLVLQAESSECGLACLAMIGGFYGQTPDMVSMRAKYAIPSQGANLNQIIKIAADWGMSARALKLELSHLEQLSLPCILHWDMNHFVVLSSVSKRSATILDPAIGKRTLSIGQVSEHFTGIALELSPTGDFTQKRRRTALTLSHFIKNTTGLKRQFVVLLTLSMLLQLFAVLSPYYMQIVIDDVIARHDTALLSVLALGFSLLLLIEVGTLSFRQCIVLALSSRLNLQMSCRVFQHLIRLPYSYFAKRHLGDVVSRFQSLGPVREMLTQGIIGAILDGFLAIVTLLVMCIYNFQLTLVTLTVVTLYFTIKRIIFVPMHRISAEQIAARANENTHFMESARAIKTIKLFNQEANRENSWQHKLVELLNKDIAIGRWHITAQAIQKLLFGAENLIIIYFAATSIMAGVMSVGMVYAFMAYKTRFIGAIDSIITTFIELRLLNVHFERLSDIVFTERDKLTDDSYHHDNTSSAPLGIDVEQITHSYSKHSPNTFTNLTFSIKPGECVAITGKSGCGKTTLLHCLMGLLTPTDGEIRVGGKQLSTSPHLRGRFAAVMQDDQCLSGNIIDNITCFDPAPDMNRVIQASKVASLHQDISNMPMQYQTLIGDMGSCLSGGQQQRLLIARALYKQPSIIFMDEATANLDVATERTVGNNIAKQKVTRVIVAHRPQTIAMADRVLHLHNGTLQHLTKTATGETP
ncbi:peptidase domain-containing ABC transporter [Alteromonas sediminis]|uniref:Peptidase domain-containing ABC transporter n=1 Tax=Alteromonas sediminis TaxID=2259342 RepID=A0A3N5XW54_9ALTE|nr:peptidase domain-containing ABC transporter [Alteromonas sediminis]RPJ64802.1 peptidase domain-containing ABC transporter [Alteromonas sediminis]